MESCCRFANHLIPDLTELVTPEFVEGFDQVSDMLRQPWF